SAVSQVSLLYSNWAAAPDAGFIVEAGSGGTLTVTASVSKDRVTWTPVTWGGASSTTIADGSNAVSDPVAIALAEGDVFYVRTWKGSNGAGKAIYSLNVSDTANNEIFRLGTSVPDCTD